MMEFEVGQVGVSEVTVIVVNVDHNIVTGVAGHGWRYIAGSEILERTRVTMRVQGGLEGDEECQVTGDLK